MKKIFVITLFIIPLLTAYSQQELSSELLEQSAFRFSLNEENQLEGEAREKWINWIGDNQFVGLAEVHNSAQLSFFTKALLNVLEEKGFEHFALEMGPNTAEILQEEIQDPDQVFGNIKNLNRQYGKKSASKTPLIFVNKVDDAVFVEEASRLKYELWGLDQEFAGSYEMLIDKIYENSSEKSETFTRAYREAKKAISKVIHKNKYKGQPVYCWYSSSEEINNFLSQVKELASIKIIEDIRKSWDIYCKSATGQGSNQQRANYMKQNFENYLDQHGSESRVFLKLGGIHLTRGISPFRVDDMGKYLTEKADETDAGFLTIRHLIAFRNGKSNIGKSGWKTVSMFLKLGRKDQWTVVDLRPFREMLERGEITTNKNFAFELRSYDLLLLSPDDQYPTINY